MLNECKSNRWQTIFGKTGCEPFTLKNNLVPGDTVTIYVFSDINPFSQELLKFNETCSGFGMRPEYLKWTDENNKNSPHNWSALISIMLGF